MCKNGFYNLLTLMIVLLVSVTAAAADEGYALLIQTSPPDAGTVAPGIGVHDVVVGQTVALSAMPKQGYQFLYWLGDVSSNIGPDTTVSVDTPKLVIAVFTKMGFDEDLPGAGISDGQYSPSGRRFYSPIQSPAAVSPGIPFDEPSFNFPTPPEPPTGDIPVPGEEPDNDDIPVPGDNEVPEPATIVLLGIGSCIFLRTKNKQ